MKLSPYPNRHAPRVRREPLRTLPELAEELGVTVVHITATMSHYAEHPKPQLTHRTGPSSSRNTWYERRPFLAWWKQVLEARK